MRVLVRIFTTRSVIPALPGCQAGLARAQRPQQRKEVQQLFVARVEVVRLEQRSKPYVKPTKWSGGVASCRRVESASQGSGRGSLGSGPMRWSAVVADTIIRRCRVQGVCQVVPLR